MLDLKFVNEMPPSNTGTLPFGVEKTWHKIISSVVSERVDQLSLKTKIDQFYELENQQHTSDLIMNVFVTHVAEALDILVFNEVSIY